MFETRFGATREDIRVALEATTPLCLFEKLRLVPCEH